jgi:hypothetical protein
MKRNLMTALKGLACAGVITSCLVSARAFAQVEVVIPPPAFIATATPVYFEGRPAYWWGGRWYFRDGGAWRFYHDEPAYLREWRGRREPERHFYGRAHWGGYRRR